MFVKLILVAAVAAFVALFGGTDAWARGSKGGHWGGKNSKVCMVCTASPDIIFRARRTTRTANMVMDTIITSRRVSSTSHPASRRTPAGTCRPAVLALAVTGAAVTARASGMSV
jgi:hypothetical protein